MQAWREAADASWNGQLNICGWQQLSGASGPGPMLLGVRQTRLAGRLAAELAHEEGRLVQVASLPASARHLHEAALARLLGRSSAQCTSLALHYCSLDVAAVLQRLPRLASLRLVNSSVAGCGPALRLLSLCLTALDLVHHAVYSVDQGTEKCCVDAEPCSVADLQPLSLLTALRQLTVDWDSNVRVDGALGAALARMPHLTSLHIGLPDFTERRSEILDLARALRVLRITHRSGDEHDEFCVNPQPWSSLTALEALHVDALGCESSTWFAGGMGELPALRTVMLRGEFLQFWDDPGLVFSCAHLTKIELNRTLLGERVFAEEAMSVPRLRELVIHDCACLDWEPGDEGEVHFPPPQLCRAATQLTKLVLSCQVNASEEPPVHDGYFSLPDALSAIAGLAHLDLAGSKGLRALPRALGALTALTFLGLSGTRVEWLPKELAEATALRVLGLSKDIFLRTLLNPQRFDLVAGLPALQELRLHRRTDERCRELPPPPCQRLLRLLECFRALRPGLRIHCVS